MNPDQTLVEMVSKPRLEPIMMTINLLPIVSDQRYAPYVLEPEN